MLYLHLICSYSISKGLDNSMGVLSFIELWFPVNVSAVFLFSCFLNGIFVCSDTTDSLLAQRVRGRFWNAYELH